MNKYEKIYKNTDFNTKYLSIKKYLDIKQAATWQDAYWMSKCMFEMNIDFSDEDVISAIKRAIGLGLNISCDREKYFDAIKRLADLYITYGEYSQSNNYLLIIISNSYNKDIPDWVYLNLAQGLVFTKTNIIRNTEDPSKFFELLNKININNNESVIRRNAIFTRYLTICVELAHDEYYLDIIAKNNIFSAVQILVEKYKLESIPEWKQYVKAFGLDSSLYKELFTPSVMPYKRLNLETVQEEPIIDKHELVNVILEEIPVQKPPVQKPTVQKLPVYEENIAEDGIIYEEPVPKIIAHIDKDRGNKLLKTLRKKRILIAGAQSIAKNDIICLGKQYGFKPDNFVFWNYKDIKNNFATIPTNGKSSRYAAMIFGAIPHYVTNMRDCSNVITYIDANKEKFPYYQIVKCNNRLKFTKNSVNNALCEIYKYLEATVSLI